MKNTAAGSCLEGEQSSLGPPYAARKASMEEAKVWHRGLAVLENQKEK